MAEKEWTDELKQEVIDTYEAGNPTPETSMEIVKAIAKDIEKTPNGVRMILSRGGVYVKQEVAKAGTGKADGTKTTRVNKAEAIDTLKKIIEDSGKTVDGDICDRLTGKAAVYFTGLLG